MLIGQAMFHFGGRGGICGTNVLLNGVSVPFDIDYDAEKWVTLWRWRQAVRHSLHTKGVIIYYTFDLRKEFLSLSLPELHFAILNGSWLIKAVKRANAVPYG